MPHGLKPLRFLAPVTAVRHSDTGRLVQKTRYFSSAEPKVDHRQW